MNKKQKRIIYLFILLLLLPAIISMNMSYSEMRSDKNNNMLPAFPRSVQQLKEWPSKFDDFSVNKFPYRTDFIQYISHKLLPFNISLSPKVVFGKNDMLFYRAESNIIDEYRGVRNLSDKQISNWISNYIARKDFIKKTGSELYLVLIPNKHTIYSHNLPDYYNNIGRPRIPQQLDKAFADNNIKGYLNLEHALLSQAQEQQLYYSYDTHWNDRGAYIGYQEVMKLIDPDHILSWITPDQINFVSAKYKGDLGKLLTVSGIIEQTEQAEFGKDGPQVSSNKNEVDYWHNEYICEAAGQQKTALFFCDSFVEAVLGKYLERTFGKSIFIRHTAGKDLQLINKYKPDIVVYCYCERLIPYSIDTFNNRK